MSNAPAAKRKVMGRIDLAADSGGTPSARTGGSARVPLTSPSAVVSPSSSRPPSAMSNKGHVRAKVDMSSMNGIAGIGTVHLAPAGGMPPLQRSPSSSSSIKMSSGSYGARTGVGAGSSTPLVARAYALDNNGGTSAAAATRARNNSADLSSTSTSSESSSLVGVATPPVGSRAKALTSTPASTQSSTALRGHARAATHHTASFFTPPTTRASEVQRPRLLSLSRSRTPSPTRPARIQHRSEGAVPPNTNGVRTANRSLAPPQMTDHGSGSLHRPSPSEGHVIMPRSPRRSSDFTEGNRTFSTTAFPSLDSSTSSTDSPASIKVSSPPTHNYGRALHGRSNSTASRSLMGNVALTATSASEPVTPAPVVSPALSEEGSLTRGAPPTGWSSDGALLSPTSDTAPALTPSQVAEAREAKKNRKIADLEITNKSLLAINAGLETQKLKQTKEIRDLRRRIREGRLSLAPGELGGQEGAEGAGAAGTLSPLDDEDGDFFEDADEGVEEDPELEAAHLRCRILVERLIIQARASLASKADVGGEDGGRARVLHPVEVAQMEEDKMSKRENANEDFDATFSTAQLQGDEGDETIPSQGSLSSELGSVADTSKKERRTDEEEVSGLLGPTRSNGNAVVGEGQESSESDDSDDGDDSDSDDSTEVGDETEAVVHPVSDISID